MPPNEDGLVTTEEISLQASPDMVIYCFGESQMLVTAMAQPIITYSGVSPLSPFPIIMM